MKRIYALLFAMLASVAVFAPAAGASVAKNPTVASLKAVVHQYFGKMNFHDRLTVTTSEGGVDRSRLFWAETPQVSVEINEDSSWNSNNEDVMGVALWIEVKPKSLRPNLYALVRSLVGKSAALWAQYATHTYYNHSNHSKQFGIWSVTRGVQKGTISLSMIDTDLYIVGNK
jgi:hypothetical protein